jgi:hypothetical protein
MKFAVGYQILEDRSESFVDVVRDYREHISEVYFPWVGMASGRAALNVSRGLVDWRVQAELERDLCTFREFGFDLDLLLNANCYGGRAVSLHLENEVGSLLTHLEETVGGVDIVTTTSPAIARTVKQYFPSVSVRASVNMRIGTIQGLSYSAGYFDSYCIQRDRQRDPDYVRLLRRWADENGKSLVMLANSGCLRFCPGQVFHDNMVAHEQEIDETANIPNWTPHMCWNLYRDRSNWPAFLQATWIRPEDLHHYDGLFDVVKLATRMHVNPRLVIHAYATRRYRGNLLDLFEPGFGPAFAPWIIDSTKIPEDWFERTSGCTGTCMDCSYCASVLEHALVNTEDFGGRGAN